MNDSLLLVVAFSVGMALGAFYFLSLWKVLQKIADIPNPGFVMLKSFVFRTAVVLTGFYFIMGDKWERVLVALAGFILMREILTRLMGKSREVF